MALEDGLLRGETEPFQLTRWRWFVLCYFSISNMNQCLAWFSFSSVDEASMQSYFGPRMDKRTLDLLLNWGPVVGVAFFPAQTWLMQQPAGLKKGMRCGIILCFLGNVVRTIPMLCVLCGGSPLLVQSPASFACYHAGQILIAAAGPFQMGAASRLACVWFGEDERTTATAIASTSNALGTTIGFLNPLWLSTSAQTIANIFWLSLGLQFIPLLCAAFYLPAAPPTSPSAAAAASSEALGQQRLDKRGGESSSENGEGTTRDGRGSPSASTAGWLASVGRGCSNRSFVILIVMAAVLAGINAAWQALFQSMLAPAGLSNKAVGWIGFGNGAAGNLGAVLSGLVLDRCFRRKLKLGILTGLMGTLLSVSWFTMQLPILSEDTPPLIALPNATRASTLTAASTLEGFFQGMTAPLIYELSAELLYPLREGMSAGFLVLLWNASSAVLIFLNGYIPSADINLVMTATVACVMVAIGLFVKEEYRRPCNEAASRTPRQGMEPNRDFISSSTHYSVRGRLEGLVVNAQQVVGG